MESKDLRFFLEVSKTGSFSQAALNLYSVQSNVTNHIKKIESEFDVKLFSRDNKAVTLTPEGEQLLFYAERVIFFLDKAQSLLEQSKVQFCIGTTASTSLLLPEFIKKCRKFDPTVAISVKVFTSEELQKKKNYSNLDCIITNNSLDIPFREQSFQIYEKLVLIYPKSELPFDHYLNNTIIVSSNQTCSYRRLLFDYIQNINNKDTVQILEFDSLLGIINSVELGIGVSLVPYKLVEDNDMINKISINKLQSNLISISCNSKTKNIYYDLLVDFFNTIYKN